MTPLMASVPPLLTPPVVKLARISFRQRRRVLPSRLTSGIGQATGQVGVGLDIDAHGAVREVGHLEQVASPRCRTVHQPAGTIEQTAPARRRT